MTTDRDWMAELFEESRRHLHDVAYRLLGSRSDAEDAVQESWLRLTRSDTSGVENLGGWLTTVTARVCLDMLRSRRSRQAYTDGAHGNEPTPDRAAGRDPEAELFLADSLGPALLVVLDTLTPPQRVAFVLHDVFDLSFEEIAPIVDRSEAATRQLASRARRSVHGTNSATDADFMGRREVVDAFLVASRDGDFEALLAVLAPDVLFRADEDAVRTAAVNKWGGEPSLNREARGRQAVAELFKGRARGARRAVIDGDPGAVWAPGGSPRSAFVFVVDAGTIVEIDLVMDPARLAAMEVELSDE